MFYYPTVLKRHSGCFSTIWLVATKGIRVPRRDFLKVNVKSTCDDIVNYLLERVPPPRPDLPRPRFSLYLSSQLQYGVVLVFHRQCVIFLEEIQSVVGQLAKQRTSQKIDMDEHSRLALDNPDALSFLEEVEGAPDPLFGVMYMHDAIHSPTTLIQMGKEFLGESSPEHPEQTSPSVDAALDNGITASPQSITLREIEPVVIPIAEFGGVELLDQHPFTIDLLLDQTDNFPEGDLEIPREEETAGDQEREIEREADPEREGTKEPTASTLELQPTATLSGEEAMLLPEEESAEILRPIPDQLTPTSVPPVPSPPPPPAARERERPTLELEDVPPAEVREKRKRQLIFFDPETQIPQAELQQDIDNPQAHTRQPTLSVPSAHRILPAAELFNKPCTFLPKEVEFLWRRAATIRPLSGSDLQLGERGPESTDSEKERQREMVEAAQIDERLELSPKEVPRDVAPQSEMFDISAHGSLPLEASDQREMSREMSPMYASERDETPVSRSVSTLQDIPEVPDEVLQRAAAESPRLLPELTEQEMPPVLFHSLLPQDADRRTVSDIFQRLLETLSTRKVYAEQSEPYGRIWILPGSNFDETVQTLGF